jgi:4-amino-4-deoxy-L-arabinose transferase-like glycosyltransferase
LLGIVGLALALRLPNLSTIPPDVHGDEAATGLDARALLHGNWGDLFRLGWAGIPQLSYAFDAVSMSLFGDDLYGLRIASVFEGVLSVILLYFVARRLFGTRPALIAAFLLAAAQWHIHLSRTGFPYIQAVAATLLVIFFMLRAFDGGRELDFVLAGMSLGVCVVVYYSAREAFLIVGLYLLYRIARERGFLRANAVGLICAVIGLAVFLAPDLVSIERSPYGALRARSEAVWLFSHDVLEHERQVYGVSSKVHVVAIQAQRTLESFNRTGETSLQYGRFGKPLLDVWSAALLVPGAAYALFRIGRSRFLLVGVWLLVPLVACTLTVDAPFSPHMVDAMPVLALLPALVLDAGWRAAGRWTGRVGWIAFALLVAAFAALVVRANYRDYFNQQVTQLRPASFFTVLSRYVLDVNAHDRIYLLAGPATSLRYDTVRFLVPHLDGDDLGHAPRLPLAHPPPTKGAAFVVDLSAGIGGSAFEALKRAYPNGVMRMHYAKNGVPLFFSYVVSNRELERRAPR